MGTNKAFGAYTDVVLAAEISVAAARKALRSVLAAAEGIGGDFEAGVALATARDAADEALGHLVEATDVVEADATEAAKDRVIGPFVR